MVMFVPSDNPPQERKVTDLSQVMQDGDRLILQFPGKHFNPDDPCEDVADHYAIIANDRFTNGIMVWAKYGGHWQANPWNGRAVIRELLKRAGFILPNKGDIT